MPIIGGKLNLDKITFLDSFLYDKPPRLFNPRDLLQALRTPLYNSTLSRLQLTYNNLHEYITLRKNPKDLEQFKQKLTAAARPKVAVQKAITKKLRPPSPPIIHKLIPKRVSSP